MLDYNVLIAFVAGAALCYLACKHAEPHYLLTTAQYRKAVQTIVRDVPHHMQGIYLDELNEYVTGAHPMHAMTAGLEVIVREVTNNWQHDNE